MKKLKFSFLFSFLLIVSFVYSQKTPEIIKNKKQGDVFQLIVNNKPFMMLAGELGNSSASSADYMNRIWPQLRKMHLNTVLVPVYWELMEPEEDVFDFTLIDEMLTGARENNLKLVLLWFGSWKNSMSCYAPSWVKKDYKRFPRTLDKNGNPSEIMSPFSNENLQADKKAFTALMKHIKSVDATEQTIIMIQVENEIGQLPEARDYSANATKKFQDKVSAGLMDYLQKNKTDLLPHIKNLWANSQFRKNGNWEEVFGKSISTDEIFASWYFAEYTDEIAKAGKDIYNLPMYVNCALNRPGVEPGKYPSAGPLPHLINIWQAAAPHIDMLSPDIYHGDFRNWCKLYDILINPVFIPEIKLDENNGAQAFYVLGRHKALGYSPFSIESTIDSENSSLSKSYKVLDDLSDMVLNNRAKTNGVYLDKELKTDTLRFGDYNVIVSHVNTLPWNSKRNDELWNPGGCIIIETSPGEFWIGGTSVVVTFENRTHKLMKTGILSADECTKINHNWIFRRLNGDQTHQGRHISISGGDWGIQKVIIYDYK